MLVNMRDLLKDAQNGNYAVGSFSVANMEMVLGGLKAAEELNAPVILQIAEDLVKCSKTGIKKINIATATFDMVEKTVHNCYNNDEIKGYYDLQGAEVQGAYENAKKHILIFGTDNKA